MGDSEIPKSTMRFLFELIVLLLIALAFSWVLRTYLIEPRKIPSPSMLPTIQVDDRVIVDKESFCVVKNPFKSNTLHVRLVTGE
jgi:signal peptidase I